MSSTKSAPAGSARPGHSGPGTFSRMSAADYRLNYDALVAGPSGRTKSKARSGTPGRAPRQSPEEDLHRAVFAWVFAHEARHPILRYMLHVPNGGARSKGEAGKLKAMGVRKGVVDVVNPFAQPGGTGFACELKAPGKGPTPEQQDYLDFARANGCVTGVCFTLEQFVALVGQYLAVDCRP